MQHAAPPHGFMTEDLYDDYYLDPHQIGGWPTTDPMWKVEPSPRHRLSGSSSGFSLSGGPSGFLSGSGDVFLPGAQPQQQGPFPGMGGGPMPSVATAPLPPPSSYAGAAYPRPAGGNGGAMAPLYPQYPAAPVAQAQPGYSVPMAQLNSLPSPGADGERRDSDSDTCCDPSVAVKLYHRTRNAKGWLSINTNDEVRVTKDRGKLVKVRAECKFQLPKDGINVDVELIDLTAGAAEYTRDGVQVISPGPQRLSGPAGTSIDFSVKLSKICKLLQLRVIITGNGGCYYSGTSVEFTTHNSGTKPLPASKSSPTSSSQRVPTAAGPPSSSSLSSSPVSSSPPPRPQFVPGVRAFPATPPPPPPQNAPPHPQARSRTDLMQSTDMSGSQKKRKLDESMSSSSGGLSLEMMNVVGAQHHRHAAGPGEAAGAAATTTVINGGLDVEGIVRAEGFLQYSDLRLKTEIEDIVDALSIISNIDGHRYRWKADNPKCPERGGERAIGLIAQEVQRVLPEAVVEDEDGYLSVAYAELIPVLIAAFKQHLEDYQNDKQEYKKEFEQLRKEIKDKSNRWSTKAELSILTKQMNTLLTTVNNNKNDHDIEKGEPDRRYDDDDQKKRQRRRRLLIVGAIAACVAIVLVVVIAIAIAVPVAIVSGGGSSSSSGNGNGNGSGNGNGNGNGNANNKRAADMSNRMEQMTVEFLEPGGIGWSNTHATAERASGEQRGEAPFSKAVAEKSGGGENEKESGPLPVAR